MPRFTMCKRRRNAVTARCSSLRSPIARTATRISPARGNFSTISQRRDATIAMRLQGASEGKQGLRARFDPGVVVLQRPDGERLGTQRYRRLAYGLPAVVSLTAFFSVALRGPPCFILLCIRGGGR